MIEKSYTISDWLSLYHQDGLKPNELLRELIQELSEDDPAIICKTPDWHLTKQLESLALQDPKNLPLFGIPFVVKDNIDVAGLPTTAACPEFSYTPSVNALVVERLMQAGAILIGKTNLDQFATGLVGTRSPFGIVPNTFDEKYVSGGSSSGSASMVARGLVPFSLGTDTAGSGRIPAGFNNIVGLKATTGKVPLDGVVPACKSIDVVSVFALTVADATKVLGIIENKTKYPLAVNQNAWFGSGKALPKLGIPVLTEIDSGLGYQQAFDDCVRQLQQYYEIVPIEMSLFHQVAQLLYDGPWVAERFITIESLYQTQPEAIEPTVKKVIEKAFQFDAVTTFKKQYELDALKRKTLAIWESIDVLVVPTAPTCPLIEEVNNNPILKNSELGLYTNFVNLLGLCAIAIPQTISQSGLPFGITLIAQGGYDHALVNLANEIVKRTRIFLGKNLRQALPNDFLLDMQLGARPYLEIAVVGAHLEGMPLHYQLQDLSCQFVRKTQTATEYALYSLANTSPPKPGLVRVPSDGVAIEIEIYKMPLDLVGSFLELIPAPLGLGSIKLADGRFVKGFICEPIGLEQAENISHFGGWRSYLT